MIIATSRGIRKRPWDAFFMNSKPRSESDRIEYDFDTSPTLNVPGDWNSQSEKLFYYEGTILYKRSFDYPEVEKGTRVFIRFGAVNYRADVYLNSIKLGIHTGGFTPFCFEVTGLLEPMNNILIVKVDNSRKREGVPTLNTDWWNYGGITRGVTIIETPATFVSDYTIRLKKDDPGILEGNVALDGPGAGEACVTLSIPELGLRHTLTTDPGGPSHLRSR